MTLRSLRLRLLFFAALGITVTLIIAGFGLTALFARHVERRIGTELDAYVAQIAGNLRLDENGDISLAVKPSDPRFQKPYGGLYWQVEDERNGRLLRSESLWDGALKLPRDRPKLGAIGVDHVEGPDRKPVLVHERRLLIGKNGDVPVRIAAAVNQSELDAMRKDFAQDLAPGLGLLGILLLVGLALQVSAGLKPLSELASGIGQIRAGRVKRLSSDVPEEVSPLVEEVNSLLAAQEQAMDRARDRAADLAHGLKTPLTALASDIRRLRQKGETQIAADIESVSVMMRRHIERELARSRLRSQPGSRPQTKLLPAISAIVGTISRTPSGEAAIFDVDVGPQVTVAFDPDDLNDVLGNLIENAARHAGARVRVSARTGPSGLEIRIEDDGPGVGSNDIDAIFERGRRLDEKGGSAGLGLAIVRDILEEYGYSLSADRSDLGGLALSVILSDQPLLS